MNDVVGVQEGARTFMISLSACGCGIGAIFVNGVNDWSGVREGQGGIVVNGEAELHGVCCDIGVCGRMHRP